MTWRPESGGKFRANVAFKVDGRFRAQVSVVGEAVDIGGGGGGGGNKGRGDARKGRKRAKGQSVGSDGGKRRSLSQETGLRGAGPYTSVRAGSYGGVFWRHFCLWKRGRVGCFWSVMCVCLLLKAQGGVCGFFPL